MTYDFQTQLKAGHAGEWVVHDWLTSQGWSLRPASQIEQRQGIDFWGMKPGQGAATFEIKTDGVAHRTGNAFVELQSSSRTGKLGWLFTCQSDFLLYWVPGLHTLYWMQPKVIRIAYSDWRALFPLREIPNQDYYTTGLLVPLPAFEAAASQTYKL